VSASTSGAPGSGTCAKPRCTAPATIAAILSASSLTVPVASPFPPEMMRAPPIGTNATVLVSPGSKRTAVPAAMSRRRPYARARSNASAPLVSMKW
jgi:hypothetical protein